MKYGKHYHTLPIIKYLDIIGWCDLLWLLTEFQNHTTNPEEMRFFFFGFKDILKIYIKNNWFEPTYQTLAITSLTVSD